MSRHDSWSVSLPICSLRRTSLSSRMTSALGHKQITALPSSRSNHYGDLAPPVRQRPALRSISSHCSVPLRNPVSCLLSPSGSTSASVSASFEGGLSHGRSGRCSDGAGVAVAVAISAHAPHQATLPDFMALVGGLDISMHNEAAMYLVPQLPGPVSREDSRSLPGSAQLRD
jgi:hypothetical protein